MSYQIWQINVFNAQDSLWDIVNDMENNLSGAKDSLFDVENGLFDAEQTNILLIRYGSQIWKHGGYSIGQI